MSQATSNSSQAQTQLSEETWFVPIEADSWDVVSSLVTELAEEQSDDSQYILKLSLEAVRQGTLELAPIYRLAGLEDESLAEEEAVAALQRRGERHRRFLSWYYDLARLAGSTLLRTGHTPPPAGPTTDAQEEAARKLQALDAFSRLAREALERRRADTHHRITDRLAATRRQIAELERSIQILREHTDGEVRQMETGLEEEVQAHVLLQDQLVQAARAVRAAAGPVEAVG